jgi:hypothetical protein
VDAEGGGPCRYSSDFTAFATFAVLCAVSAADDAPVGLPSPFAAADDAGLFPGPGDGAGGVSGVRCSATAVAGASAVDAEKGRSTGRVAKYKPAPTKTQAAMGTQTHRFPRVDVGSVVRSPSGTAVSFNRAISASARRHLGQVAKWASHSARSVALIPSST